MVNFQQASRENGVYALSQAQRRADDVGGRLTVWAAKSVDLL
jgi:hypothetical protein